MTLSQAQKANAATNDLFFMLICSSLLLPPNRGLISI